MLYVHLDVPVHLLDRLAQAQYERLLVAQPPLVLVARLQRPQLNGLSERLLLSLQPSAVLLQRVERSLRLAAALDLAAPLVALALQLRLQPHLLLLVLRYVALQPHGAVVRLAQLPAQLTLPLLLLLQQPLRLQQLSCECGVCLLVLAPVLLHRRHERRHLLHAVLAAAQPRLQRRACAVRLRHLRRHRYHPLRLRLQLLARLP